MAKLNRIQTLALYLALIAPAARAEWQPDGVAVSTIAVNQRPDAVSDGAGGAIVTWRGGTDIYAQRLNAAGVPQWTANGVVLCTAANSQNYPTIVSDGAGGAIVTWHDARNSGTANFDIYAQRVNASGVPQWTANGVALCTATNQQDFPTIVSDGAGGAIVTWQDARSVVTFDIYAQRVNAAGVPQWTADGVALSTAASNQHNPKIVSDGAGGAIATWYDYRSGTSYDIYAQRVSAAGAPQWTADGVALCAVANMQDVPTIVSDGAGGAIVTWNDSRNSNTQFDIYAQRVNASGAPQWTPDGVALCTAVHDQAHPEIVSDGSGGAIVAWADFRTDVGHIYAQRVDAGGIPQWTIDGVALCTADSGQGYQKIVADGSGGAIVTWNDFRSSVSCPDILCPDIYAQRVSESGVPQWTANGVALCTAGEPQQYPAIVSDEAGGAIVAWNDYRSGNVAIYAQRVGWDGTPFSFTVTTTAEDYVTGTLWEAIIQANEIPGPKVIRFDIPGPGPHTIQALCLPFPAITEELTIDGFTQSGASPNTNPVGSPSNAQIKIEISGPWWGLGWSGLVFQAPGTLRGVAISGFDASVKVESPGVVIEGNYIGTDVTGLLVGPHQARYGVHVLSDACRVGGSSPAARNVISWNYADGIRIDGGINCEVYGNYIGVGADATAFLANDDGIRILNGAGKSWIGSSAVGTSVNPSEANLIVGNFSTGVVVEGSTCVRNLICGNYILNNLSTSIDLGDDGLNPNDANDADTGPNEHQNYPDVSSALGHEIAGTMMGAPNAAIYLHFYQSPNCCFNAATYVGAKYVELDGSGNAPFTFTLTQPIQPGGLINATATDLLGNTSEVSLPVAYQNTPPGTGVTVDLVDASGNVRGTATYDDVTSAGNTFLANPFTPPVPVSANFTVGNPNDPSIYFDVTTDASYTGGVEVCLFYDENNIPGPEANLVLAHYNGSIWEDVTTTRDEANNKICGHVTTLSPFVIAVLTPTAVGDTPTPTSFALHPNIPNPFNPQTTIRYDVPAGGADVGIAIYNVAGRLVRELVDEHRGAGTWSAQWNGEDDRGRRVASGVYFYRMRAGSFVETRKMVLLK